ncbi:MAG: cupin domain-containing protein [Deltaproteobacteria bacterium]|jgi:mannose-6-phosphate isomerase-like protein (cupin superfamily)|nr:cupin domain-containing protein [Deltaproteobacteria bacterium]
MLITSEQAARSITEKAKGGLGHVSHVHYINPKSRPASTRVAMAAINTIPVGSSLGYHIHETDEELFFILEGQGVFTDTDHKEYQVSSGDVTLCRQGESHGLVNSGTTPLVFAAIIIDSGN